MLKQTTTKQYENMKHCLDYHRFINWIENEQLEFSREKMLMQKKIDKTMMKKIFIILVFVISIMVFTTL